MIPAKIAAYHLSKVQEILGTQAIDCSFSTVFCKPIAGYNCKIEDMPPISAYTFLRPARPNLPYDEVLPLCDELLKKQPSVSLEAYWNNSLYPLVVAIRGENYKTVARCICAFRSHSQWAIDSCSYITLKIDPSQFRPMDDEVDKEIRATIFLKLSSLQDISIVETLLEDTQSTEPSGVFGWYDFSCTMVCKNLRELYEKTLEIKNKSNGKIIFTSTVLKMEVKSFE